MWISVCSLPEWRSQITLFFPLFYGNVLIFSIKRQMYSNHLLYCSWWISRFLWYTSPPGAICKSDAAGSIQIKIALFFPGGEIHFFTQSVINCTHTHTRTVSTVQHHISTLCWLVHAGLEPATVWSPDRWRTNWILRERLVFLSRSFQLSVCIFKNLAV